MKFVYVTMPDKTVWGVPVLTIILNYANFLCSQKNLLIDEAVEQAKLALDYKYGIIDWASGNMDWSDVCEDAVLVSSLKCDYQEGWINGYKEIVDHD